MAIDKSRTSAGMKAIVIVIIAAFVLFVAFTALASLDSSSTGSQNTATDTINPQLDQFAVNAQSVIAQAQQTLAKKPKDYTSLKTIGDAYSDWAFNVKKVSPSSGLDVLLFQQAIAYYQRALALKPSVSAVRTDMAVAQFSSNETAAALATIDSVRARDPKFAPAAFNAGIFYGSLGQNAKALSAFDAYLKLEPTGTNAQNAKDFITQLKAAAVPTGTPTGQ
jgi:tetratricopeptide (TPR) repeat protein